MGALFLLRDAPNLHSYYYYIFLVITNRPTVFPENAADAPTWAHPCCWKMLPMVTKWPADSSERCFQFPCMWPFLLSWMGLLFLLRGTADALVWAHPWCWKILLMVMNGLTVYQEMLLMLLNEPVISDEGCWWWPRMGPVFVAKNVADTIGQAHSYCYNMLPMATNGPSDSTKNFFPCHWMGPLWLLKYTANDQEWAQQFN